MIDFKEIGDGESWELFARDFLKELGYTIEVPPDRGADGGRDIIVTENLSGHLGTYSFRWIVSCKHFAVSGKSVNNDEEKNLLERVKKFKAQGFIGFYSTIVSSGLNDTLVRLKESGDISDFAIFDHKMIESKLIKKGSSQILQRYFPESYKKIKPLHLILDNYQPLECGYCGKDLLAEENLEDTMVGFVHDPEKGEDISYIEDIYWAHKGKCDRTLESRARTKGLCTSWNDIADLSTPLCYLKFLFGIMNNLEACNDEYSEHAFKKLREFILAVSQRTLREITEEERERFKDLQQIPF